MDFTSIKAQYKAHLFTPAGAKMMASSVAIKKKSVVDYKREKMCVVSTEGVKMKHFPKELKPYVHKIQITPICLNNQCYENSRLISTYDDKMKARLGFNVLACPCGKYLQFELHSVNRHDDGTYYDFTIDFNDEKEKYFVEFQSNIDVYAFKMVFSDAPKIVNKGCKCPIVWNDKYLEKMTEKHLVEMFDAIGGMRIANKMTEDEWDEYVSQGDEFHYGFY